MRVRGLLAVFVAGLVIASPAFASGWSVQPAPRTSGSNRLIGVSCASGRVCIAVGGRLAERRDGQRWSIQALPHAGQEKASGPVGVSCTSRWFCIAVGSFTPESGATLTLAERWNGRAWSIQGTPNPSYTLRATLTSVSCTSSSTCTAVGWAVVKTGGYPGELTEPIAERWNGQTWSFMKLQAQGGGRLTGVSCPSSTACMAVGTRPNFTSSRTFAERWNGRNWSIVNPLNPGGRQDDVLNAISCSRGNRCTAVGGYSARDYEPLAERWDGTRWSVQSVPAHSRSTTAHYLYGISCPSNKACTAVGSSYAKSGAAETIGEFWDGTAWSLQKTVNPKGSVQLLGVSCTSRTACTAVGDRQRQPTTGRTKPLIEHYS